MTKKRVGFIGLGLMGKPMSSNLAKAGYPLTVFDVLPAKIAPLAELGAAPAASAREVAEKSEVVITMLNDAPAIERALAGPDGLLAGARPGLVWVDMSTIGPDQARDFAARAEAEGVRKLEAPVFGSTGNAADGSLGLMVGGDRQVFEDQLDVLSVLGKHFFYLGGPGAGATAKLACNLMVAAQVFSMAEAMVLAAKGGIPLGQMGEIISASGFVSGLITRKIPNMVSGDYSPAFSVRNVHKDLELMVHTAHQQGAALPMTAVMHQMYCAAMAEGLADRDMAAIFKVMGELAGLNGGT
ncbi:MAG TPA: NAD(P)-dependent oxidoreductase [Anaerolineales bacterium]|nr:NAD(P)-dependent oxidoreductase [Anaerolineales bacterium]